MTVSAIQGRATDARRLIEQLQMARKTIISGVDLLIETVEAFDREVALSSAPPATSDEALLDRKEAAKFIGVSDTVLSDWVSRGVVPHKRLPAGSEDASRDIIRFDKTELRRWLDQRSAGAAA